MPRLLMTRARADSDRFLSELDPDFRNRLDIVYAPLIETRPICARVDLSGLRGVIFTSANGVRAASALNIDPAGPCHCVGARTTEQASAAGWDARQAGANADDLVATLSKTRPDAPLLHLRGAHARGDIARRLTQAGIATREQVIYDQILHPPGDPARKILAQDVPVIVPLFSPRTARQFADHAVFQAPLYLAAMSQAVADAVNTLKYRKLLVADHPDSAAMIRCVEQLAKLASRVEGGGEPQ